MDSIGRSENGSSYLVRFHEQSLRDCDHYSVDLVRRVATGRSRSDILV